MFVYGAKLLVMHKFLDKEYIHIDNYNTFGKFYAHHGPRELTDELTAVFKRELIADKKTKLVPGFYNPKTTNFIEAPIEQFYVRLYEIVQEESMKQGCYNVILTVKLDILNKIKQVVYSDTLTFEKEGSFTFMFFNDFVNYINKYIESGNEISDINFQSINPYSFRESKKEEFIYELIKMDFKAFDCSRNNPGKDNSFWTEIELRNLPKNKYVRSLIETCLKKQGRIEQTDFGILLSLPSDRAWAPSFSRKSSDDSDDIIKQVYSILLLDFGKLFDNDAMIIHNLKTST